MAKVKEPTITYHQISTQQALYISTAQMERQRLYTYDDFLTFPNDGTRYEIIKGEVCMSPSPSLFHQDIIGNLYKHISNYVQKNKLGKIYFAPTDVIFSMTSIAEPDILFVSSERQHILTKKNIIAAPDFVIEVLSQANQNYDEVKKKNLYEQFGVKEYWIVDPEKQTVQQFVLEKEKYSTGKIFSSKEKITSAVIKGLRISVKKIFET